jgi:Protein of unknown function with PCYCGC motif
MMRTRSIHSTLLLLLMGCGVWLAKYHPRPIAGQDAVEEPLNVPAYHAIATNEALPTILSSRWFHDPIIRNAYAFAASDRKLLYQLPCYCYCDRLHGHKSLLDCFVDDHGAMCSICLREAAFAQHAKAQGMNVSQIRAAIVRGDWRTSDIIR